MFDEYDNLPKPPKDKDELQGNPPAPVRQHHFFPVMIMKDLAPIIFKYLEDETIQALWNDKSTRRYFRRDFPLIAEVRKRTAIKRIEAIKKGAKVVFERSQEVGNYPSFHLVSGSLAEFFSKIGAEFILPFHDLCELIVHHLNEGQAIPDEIREKIIRDFEALEIPEAPEDVYSVSDMLENIFNQVNEFIEDRDTRVGFVTLQTKSEKAEFLVKQITEIFLSPAKNSMEKVRAQAAESGARLIGLGGNSFALIFSLTGSLGLMLTGPFVYGVTRGSSNAELGTPLAIGISVVGTLLLLFLILREAQKRRQILTRAGEYLRHGLYGNDPERQRLLPASANQAPALETVVVEPSSANLSVNSLPAPRGSSGFNG